MKFLLKIACLLLLVFHFFSCKKNKITTDSGAKVQFSQDSVLFDTVFTSIGSSTRKFLVRNKNSQKISISDIQLAGGPASAFKINVDGAPGTAFSDVEIAAHDSMYVFVQVNVNPNNVNSPFIIRDSLMFTVNGNHQQVQLEAWGQNAYYHRPTDFIKFSDGTYLTYSICDSLKGSFTMAGDEVVWNNDKPHVIYSYCVVDSTQKLRIPAGTRVYLNYKAGLWVFRYGQIQVLGQKGNEVLFQAARRDREYIDEPGQWDRIWINEGSDNNIIDYAIIKDGYIGIQAELFGNTFGGPGQLTLTNTKIQNMSKWGLYCLAYKVYAGNNVITNCQEYCLNVELGGAYSFIHCTFANYWSHEDKPRAQLPCARINNYSDKQVLPILTYFGNSIIDGSTNSELAVDLKSSTTSTVVPSYTFSSCWIKTTGSTTDANHYFDVKASSTDNLKYKDVSKYNFMPDNEPKISNFNSTTAATDVSKFPADINGKARNTFSITAGAYEP